MLKYLFNIKNHPYNRAAKKFRQLRYLDQGNQECQLAIAEINKLCREALILNKYDGDAHVLLANVYLLAAFSDLQEFNSEGYVHNMSHCAAVIYEWKIYPRMYSKEKENGEKIYQRVINALEEPLPDWMNMGLPNDISKLHKDYYAKAIGLEKT